MVSMLKKNRFEPWSVGVVCSLAAMAVISAPAAAQWTQWGGPNGDFKVETKGLADKWPEEGPKKIWSRELGEGYSAISADDGVLYTMYRSDGNETVIALDAKTGGTVWEFGYPLELRDGHITQFGEGPRSTPILAGDRVFAVGVNGDMHCLDKKTGKEIWKHDLWEEYDGTFLNHGYSSTAYPYKDTIIALNGGENSSMIAFKQSDGSEVWKKNTFDNSYATPKLINVDGLDVLLCYMGQELVGINPSNGDMHFKYEIGNQWNQNICPPVWGDDNMLFFSALQGGSRGMKLTRNGDQVDAEEVWNTRKIQFYHVTAIGIGDWVYGSSGGGMGGPQFYSCINRKTGKIAWRERGLKKAVSLYADGKFILLDEDGVLALAKATTEKFEILSQVQLLERVAWTVPTLVGKTLYVRDQKSVMALDLG